MVLGYACSRSEARIVDASLPNIIADSYGRAGTGTPDSGIGITDLGGTSVQSINSIIVDENIQHSFIGRRREYRRIIGTFVWGNTPEYIAVNINAIWNTSAIDLRLDICRWVRV